MAYKTVLVPSKIKLIVNPLTYVPLIPIEILKSHVNRAGSKRMNDVTAFIDSVYGEVFQKGINPDVLIGMSHLETDIWRSEPWELKLNPGGIGGDTPERQIIFDTGKKAARAMATHLMVYAKGHDNNFAEWIPLDPIYEAPYEAGFAKSATTLAALGDGKWAAANGYKTLVANRIAEIRDSWQWDTTYQGPRPPFEYK